MIDKIFKIGLIILGVIFLIIYFHSSQKSQNGRYFYSTDGRSRTVFDTREGVVYVYPVGDSNMVLSINPLTKEASTGKLKLIEK